MKQLEKRFYVEHRHRFWVMDALSFYRFLLAGKAGKPWLEKLDTLGQKLSGRPKTKWFRIYGAIEPEWWHAHHWQGAINEFRKNRKVPRNYGYLDEAGA